MKGPDADAELGGSAAALKKLGGAYKRYPRVHPAGRQRAAAGGLQKDFANSDSLPPQRRKNCKKASLI